MLKRVNNKNKGCKNAITFLILAANIDSINKSLFIGFM